MSVPVPSTDPTSARSTANRWSVGTLRYSLTGLMTLFGLLLLGDFAFAMRERSVVPVSQVLFRQLGASDLTNSLLFGSIPAVLTILIWPVLSVWSDRTRTRRGRRIPFLLWSAPVVAVAMAGLAFSPALGGWLQDITGSSTRETWVIGTFSAFWILFEVFALVSNNIFTALVTDTVPRQVIGRFFALFRMVSLGAGILFSSSLLTHAETHSSILFLAIGAIYLAGFLVMCSFVREGSYPPPPPLTHASPYQAVIGFCGDVTGHPFHVVVFLALSLMTLTFMPGGLFLINMTRAFDLDLQQFGTTQTITYAISLACAFPVGWLTDRFHATRTALISFSLYVLLNVVAFFWVHDAASFTVMFITHGVLAGAYFTASASLMPVLFPRLRFSQYFAAANVAINIVGMVGAPLFGMLLDATHGNYQLVYLCSATAGLAAIGAWVPLLRAFNRLGGVDAYQAPEPRSSAGRPHFGT